MHILRVPNVVLGVRGACGNLHPAFWVLIGCVLSASQVVRRCQFLEGKNILLLTSHHLYLSSKDGEEEVDVDGDLDQLGVDQGDVHPREVDQPGVRLGNVRQIPGQGAYLL